MAAKSWSKLQYFSNSWLSKLTSMDILNFWLRRNYSRESILTLLEFIQYLIFCSKSLPYKNEIFINMFSVPSAKQAQVVLKEYFSWNTLKTNRWLIIFCFELKDWEKNLSTVHHTLMINENLPLPSFKISNKLLVFHEYIWKWLQFSNGILT